MLALPLKECLKADPKLPCKQNRSRSTLNGLGSGNSFRKMTPQHGSMRHVAFGLCLASSFKVGISARNDNG